MNLTLFDRQCRYGNRSSVAVESGTRNLSFEDLLHQAESLAFTLITLRSRHIALHMDNGIDWIVADLACQLANRLVVPLPLFFSDQQIQHALASGGIDTVITDQDISVSIPGTVAASGTAPLPPVVDGIYRLQPQSIAEIPVGTQKITFTSGTTGTPKGVCLCAEQQLKLAESLVSVINIPNPRHLCVLPLSTLLENLAGVYTPLIAGGTVIVPPLSEVGLNGSSGLDIKQLLRSISHYEPDSLILVPELLNALLLAARSGWKPPASLKFVAVGGGKVAPEMLRESRQLGIPAFEGYGLSENASVVCLNVPGADRVGSVGKPLPHMTVRADRNELVVSGNTFLGYINQPDTWGMDSLRTGDTGYVDEDGFVHVDGRIKNQMISSFGRNISPEWVESELLAGSLLKQAVVVGDDRPCLVALVYPHQPATSDEEIDAWVGAVNTGLPDYAQIVRWHRIIEPLAAADGLLTENGRPKRTRIETTYQNTIDDMYELRNEAYST